ncbi:MAG TPA: hypothetical protein PKX91_01775 [Clostridia bacterium]|jgi:hypothetical protein|nr:hypothetical protein [Clostridia bacterium]
MLNILSAVIRRPPTQGEIIAAIVLGVIIAILTIVIIYLLIKYQKKRSAKADTVPFADAPKNITPKEVADTKLVEKEVAPAPTEKADEWLVQDFVEQDIIKEEFEEKEFGFKEAMALAGEFTVGKSEITKKSIADYLERKHGAYVELNRRANYNASGNLPLADTHYDLRDGGRECFVYVYELRDGRVFLLVKIEPHIERVIKKKHPLINKSSFPRHRKDESKRWYCIFVDDTFVCGDDLYKILDLILEKDEEGLELGEIIDIASKKVSVDFEINKEKVAVYLQHKYGSNLELNCRENYTQTGLPLADTHYDLRASGRYCFAYIYELENNKMLFLVKVDEARYNLLKELHPSIQRSRFPKSSNKAKMKWYSVIIDNTFRTLLDVFRVLDIVLGDQPVMMESKEE